MKNVVWMLIVGLLLSGCGAEDTFETVADEWVQPAAAALAEIRVVLPEWAAAPVSESENGTLYQCEGYEILLQTLPSGDLDATVRAVSGFGREDLTVIETCSGAAKRFDLVWSCLGEEGERVGRACILDDGNYHYVLAAMAEADRAGEFEEDWSAMFSSYSLVGY